MSKYVRHFAYHIWAAGPGNQWIWNIKHVRAYINQFDGVRSVAVAKSHNAATVAQVKEQFKGVRIDNWLEINNEPQLREVKSFLPLMDTIKKYCGPKDITFYGHAKGVRHPEYNTVPLIWAHVMYRLMLEKPERIDELIEKWPFVGAFKRYTEFRRPKHDVWHYSGTYYWFRNKDVFVDKAAIWRDLAPAFYCAVEAWPSRLYKKEETGCYAFDKAGNLYDVDTWRKYAPELKEKFGIVLDLPAKQDNRTRQGMVFK